MQPVQQPYIPQPIDPALFQQQAAGTRAQAQLANLLRGPQMQDAMLNKYAELPGVTGEGLASNAPNLFQVLATGLQRGRGRKQMSDLEAQAKALRGEMQTGKQAELAAQEENRQRNLDMQMRQVLEAQAARKALEEQRLGTLREDFETWVDTGTGELKQLATTRGKGIVDENMQPVTDLGNFRRLEKKSPIYGIGSKQQQKVAARAYTTLRNLDGVKTAASSLSDDEIKLLNRPLLDVAIKLAPGDLETYAREQKIGLTPKVKSFLNRLNLAAANLRHELYGAAVTEMENALANAFIPGAAGLTLEDSMRRLDVFADSQRNVLAGIEDAESMKPGTLTGRITYEFPSEISSVKQRNTGTQTPTLGKITQGSDNLTPLTLTDEELNYTDAELDAAIQGLMQQINQ